MKKTLFKSLPIVALTLGALSPLKASADTNLKVTNIPLVVEEINQRYHVDNPDARPKELYRNSLRRLVHLLRTYDSKAQVTSGFNAWRGYSVYRSRPGLHNGYDVGLYYGCPIPTAWEGQITRITYWYGGEYGVTLRTPENYEITFGHIKPGVKVGQTLRTGQLVGKNASDHLDVKIKDPSGKFYDYGSSTSSEPLPVSRKDQILASWLVHHHHFAKLSYELANKKGEQIENNRLQLDPRELEKLASEGVISRVSLESSRGNNNDRELASLDTLQKKYNETLNSLNAARLNASQMGLSWDDVEQFANGFVSQNDHLSNEVSRYKMKHQVRKKRMDKESPRYQELKEKLNKEEQLFQEGVISRKVLEQTRQQLHIFEQHMLQLD